ncbi:response regulator [Paenibacillus thalictri]|uniref:Response regulator n=2 Tax=Paenibacillus thalictri TaxID=2527873 RepID=A0A4Q9DS08_9BACL|nr:response regulator [Paenibacillus thalictri]
MFQLLIVDDEPFVVDDLADTLPWEEIGIGLVYKAYSGVEALEILKSNPIDVMITDIQMPELNGLELLEQVNRNWKRVKCLLLSGHAEFSYAQQAIKHHICDYLLKPIGDEEVLEKVGLVVQALQKEREESQNYQRIVKAFEENLPKLRGDFLGELLQGKVFSAKVLTEKLHSLKIAVPHNCFALMLARLEGEMLEFDFYNLSLMEFAVINIAEEIFHPGFRLWSCKDVHGYLSFMVLLPEDQANDGQWATAQGREELEHQLELMGSQLQMNVSKYLKGTVSVLLHKWGSFPQDIPKLYQDSLLSLRRRVGNQSEMLVCVTDETEQLPVQALHKLYEPPLLIHLLESGQWEVMREKLTGIVHEIRTKHADSPEYLIEAFFSIYAAFSSYAHKNGRELADMIGSEMVHVAGTGITAYRSLEVLENWIFEAARLLQQSMEHDTRSDRESAVSKIHQFVQRHLADDVSLQAIADYLNMHPVHVSRLYKLETDENLSDYVLRLKMELAASLLRSNDLKIYEIGMKLGYPNPNYFIKVFKKHYALTPQEFRLKLEGGAAK